MKGFLSFVLLFWVFATQEKPQSFSSSIDDRISFNSDRCIEARKFVDF